MAVEHQLEGDTAVYTIIGLFDRDTAKQYLSLNTQDYNQIGDALGAIIDYRQMTRFTISGLRIVQENLRGVQFETPVAFIGNPDSILITFLKGLEALTSRGNSRFSFFKDLDEAQKWIDAWYVTNRKDRQALRGQVSTTYHFPRQQQTE
ncbi:MAG: hypothetical protein H6658_16235 [Ardenticatenaceae bacterium]|nr:hypothetical protein [Ardenticatenaceae bacterium]